MIQNSNRKDEKPLFQTWIAHVTSLIGSTRKGVDKGITFASLSHLKFVNNFKSAYKNKTIEVA